jgi:hypothetical protein
VAWPWDPFKGKIENGVLYARGAGDEKGSTPGMVYGIALSRDLENAAIIKAISEMEPQLGDHEFLGHGKITVLSGGQIFPGLGFRGKPSPGSCRTGNAASYRPP